MPGNFEEYREQLRAEYSEIDFDYELKKFNAWWDSRDARHRPRVIKLCLLNWMTKARRDHERRAAFKAPAPVSYYPMPPGSDYDEWAAAATKAGRNIAFNENGYPYSFVPARQAAESRLK
jgi:hypothetical protein